MKYIIELVADSKGVQAGVDALEQIGKIDKENAAQFKKTNEEVKKYTSSVDKLSKGLKDTSKAATGAFGGEAIKGATKQSESFRAQLRASRDELTKLLQSGEATTSQIYDMARAGGELKDSMGDAQQAINVLSSDTFKLDAALQGIQVGAAGFQILQGAAALAGDENEDLQKTLVRLNAVMAITQGLQQIQNALQKQTALSLGLNIAAQKTYTLVVGTSTGALKAFRIALAATGIGLAVIAIAALVQNWDKLKASINGTNSALQDNIDIQDKQIAVAEKRLEMLDIEEKKLRLLGASERELLKIREYKTAQLLGEVEVQQTLVKEQLDSMTESNAKLTALKNMNGGVGLIASLFYVTDDELAKVQERAKELEQKAMDLQSQLLDTQLSIKEKNDEKKVKQEEKTNTKILDQYIQSLIKRRQSEADFEAWFKMKEEERLAFIKAQREKETQIYIESVKRRRELEAEQQKYEDDKRKEDNAKRLEESRDSNREQIELQAEKELTIKETAISIAQETADTIFQIAANNRNAEFNARVNALNAQKEKELSNKNLTDAQKARIEERYQKQVAALKTRQAQQEKQAAIIQATINGALAITNILATMPGGPLNPATIASLVIAGVTTATNIALIASQKIPKFAKGTEYVQGAGTETSDSIPAMLSKGERVIDAKTNKMLKGIPNSMLPELLVPSKTVISKGMDYDKLAKTLSKELSKSPQMRVSFDKEGFNSYIMSRNNTTNIKNNRYDF